MQIMLDTATDTPAELYKVGKYLVDTYAVTPIVPQDAGTLEPEPAPRFAPVPPPPPPALSVAAGMSADVDPDIEADDDSNVTGLSVLVTLPAAPAPIFPADALPAAVPAPPGPAGAVEFDSLGYPWDSRIHASNRAKKINGTWKNKRGVDANLIVACEAQNKPGNVTPPPPLHTSFLVPPPPPLAAPSAVTGPVAPSTSPAESAPIAAAAIDFRGLMQKIQSATAAGKLTTEQVNAAMLGVGLKPEDMALLINNPVLIASVNGAIDRCVS